MLLYGVGSDVFVFFFLFGRVMFFAHSVPTIKLQMADLSRVGSMDSDIKVVFNPISFSNRGGNWVQVELDMIRSDAVWFKKAKFELDHFMK